MIMANRLHFTYHILGTVKILLALVIMALAALLAGRTTTADALRRNWRFWLTLTLLIGILTVAVGSVMRTYPRTPRLDTPPGPTIIAP
jgi:heme A synthase